MGEDLQRKIWFGKIAQASGLGAEDASQLNSDAGARQLLVLNGALAECAAAQAAWPPPELEGVMRRAVAATEPTATTTRLRWAGWAGAAAVAVLAVFAVLQVLQLIGGETLKRAVAPAGVAWAEVDGYVLEYDLAFDEYFSGTVTDPPDHPVWKLNNAVEQWAVDNGVAFLTDGPGPRVMFELDRYQSGYMPEDKAYSAMVRIRLPGVDEEKKDRLLLEIAQIAEVSEPLVFSETMYFSEKYPETYYPGRTLVINGMSYVYPQDFLENEADSLRVFIMALPSEHGHGYFAFYKIGDGERIPLADVIKVRYGETVYVDDYLEHYDRNRLNLASFEETESVFIAESETGLDFDPIELMERTSNRYGYSYYGEHNWLNRRGVRYVVNLLPEQSWRGIPEGGSVTVSDQNREAARRQAGELDAVVLGWVKQFPEIAEGGDLTHLLEHGIVNQAGEPVQWQVTLWLSKDKPNRLLESALRQAGAEGLRVWQMRPSSERIKEENQQLGGEPDERPYWTISYDFIEKETEHGPDYLGAVKRASAERKAETLRQAKEMEEKFNLWLEEYRKSDPDIEASFSTFELEGAAVSSTAFIYSKEESVVSGVLEAIRIPGAPEPEKHFIENPGQWVQGVQLQAKLFDYPQFIGVGPEEAKDAISAEQLETAEALAKKLGGVCEEWESANAGSDIKLRWYEGTRFGDVPLALYVATNQPPSEAIDELEAYLTDSLGVSFEQMIPIGYNAGGNVMPADIPPGIGSGISSDILRYHIGPTRAYSITPKEKWADLFLPGELDELEQLIAIVENAVDQWNETNPPEPGAEPVAKVVVSRSNGIPMMISIISTRINEETMLSLAQALEETGLPEYQYGIAYINRHALSVLEPGEPVKGQHWIYNFVPTVRWMGKDMSTIGDEFSEEETQETLDKAEALKAAVIQWMDRHPDLGNHKWLGDYFLQGDSVEYRGLFMDGVVIQVDVGIWMNDDERRQELVDELIQFITDETGLEFAGRVMGGARNIRTP